MATGWEHLDNPNYTQTTANKKFGSYEPDKYDYNWENNYLNRYAKTSQEKLDPELLETEGQKTAREYLTNSLNTGATPYDTSKRVADNPYASEMASTLESYANRSQPELYGQAQNVISNSLTGGYDPNTSQYYEGVRQSADLNLADALNRYGQQQYLTGNLRATPTDTGQARLIAENTANLNQTLGQLALQERQNQMQSVNQAMSLGQLQDQFGANTLNAYASISPLLQQTEQAKLDAQYEEFIRQQSYGNDLANTLLNSQSTYMYPQYRTVNLAQV